MHVIINCRRSRSQIQNPRSFAHNHQLPPLVRGIRRVHDISHRGSAPPSTATMPPPPPVERKPSYIQFTPKRSIPSFENLVALANYEERLKGARKIVWRDRGELPVEIHDLWECLKHSTRGGLSEFNRLASVRAPNLTIFGLGAGTLAFVIRAGVNFILLLTRLKRIKRYGACWCVRHRNSADRSPQRVSLRRD